MELDHHCPWIGKCVGRDNINAFYVFIFMTFGNLILTFIATMVNAVIDGQNSVANNTHNLAIQT